MRPQPAPTGAAPDVLRIAFCVAPPGGRFDDAAPAPVTALLRRAGTRQVLTTGATAALAGPTLPAGVELVGLGPTADDRHDATPDDRHDATPDARRGGIDDRPGAVFELRVRGHERPDGAPATASNLDWARRLSERHVVLADGDRAALVDRWRGALDGVGTIALVTSPDGDLASTAAAELALRAHADGAVVLHGSWDFDAPRPYGAFREALGVYASECSLARVRADLDRHGRDVARLLPELAARLGSPPAPRGPQHDEGCRVGDALSGWCRAIASRDDLLVVLDNAQWADRTSLHLCEQLSNDLADHRVLVALCGAEHELRANGLLDVATALTSSADGAEHWIRLEST